MASGLMSVVMQMLTLLLAVALLSRVVNAQAPRLRVGLPSEGTVVTLPIAVTGHFDVPDPKSLWGFENGTASLCVEIDGRTEECKLLDPTTFIAFVLKDLSLGSHSLRLVVRAPGGEHALIMVSSSVVTFTNLENSEFMGQMHEFHLEQESPDLLTWFEALSPKSRVPVVEVPMNYAAEPSRQPPLVVVGVKTSVLYGFPFRQAIRETWASKSALAQNVQLLFIGCRPDAPEVRPVVVQSALDLERQQYGDLLTHELDCNDGYDHLVRKVTEFLAYVTALESNLQPQYVMIADDDIYLRTPELVNALQYQARSSRYYAGQVYATQFGIPMLSIRNPLHRNYISEAQYPMDELVPYAVGAHFIMSIDCAQFIARNRKQLRALASLDDVSIAFWLLMLQVHPEHSSAFHSLRNSGCQTDDFLSLADLSPTGIRAIHDNAKNRQNFCHGMNRTEWQRMDYTLVQSLRARAKLATLAETEVIENAPDKHDFAVHDQTTAR